MGVLSSEQLSEALESLGEGWAERDGALRKEYRFADFAAAMSFANRVAEAAEAADHHPDMLVGWGRVEARLGLARRGRDQRARRRDGARRRSPA